MSTGSRTLILIGRGFFICAATDKVPSFLIRYPARRAQHPGLYFGLHCVAASLGPAASVTNGFAKFTVGDHDGRRALFGGAPQL
jgi:hypothetical protein